VNNYLYIIVPYFNFIKYKSGVENLELFIKNSKKYSNAKVVLIEGVYNKDSELNDYSGEIFKHIKVNVENVMWIKENLINIAISKLPDDWEYVGWIDRDIEFENDNWVNECIEKLKSCDLLQPWRECIFLDKYGKPKQEDYFNSKNIKKKILSQCYIYSESIKNDEYFEHPGQAWCCNRKFYNKIGKLCDKAIVGGGDSLIMVAIKKLYNACDYSYISKYLKKYSDDLEDTKICYLDQAIYHHYHGSLENRSYKNRYNILHRFRYNPDIHLTYNEDGVLKFTETGMVFEHQIKNYFFNRKEDSN
jgi:hypothetical protein